MDAQKCDMCRLCLGSISGCDETLLNNNNFLVESIFLITGLTVVSNAEQCEYLCGQCQTALEQCVEFRLTCINNDGVFREMIGSNHVEDCKSELQKPVVEYVKLEPIDLGEPVSDVNEILESNHTLLNEVVEPKKGQAKNKNDDSIDLRKPKKIRKVQCQQCGAQVDRYHLKLHLEIHNPNRKEQCCPHCPKKYVRTYDLKRHIDEQHTSRSRYPCDECGKSYISRDTLQVHYRAVHKGEKRYPCRFCEERFTRASVRSSHHRTVHGTAPLFVCEYCDKTFKFKRSLNQHLQRHNKKKSHKLIELSEENHKDTDIPRPEEKRCPENDPQLESKDTTDPKST